MWFPSSATAATILAAGTLAHARLSKIGIPQTIKPGDVFNATVQQLAGSPLQYTMIFGVERYDNEWSEVPHPGSLGPVLLATVDLQQTVGNGTSSENSTIPGLRVPEDFAPGPAAIQAVVLGVAGPLNTPLLETWWWGVNITNATSERRNWASYEDDNSRVCQIPLN
ncbi:hypothetical protein F4810DRAFT_710546 [Camillea tinctor]|nr:hypothetical protein F4810DRAFT_710546 [Camillea tinctor]